VRDAVLWSGGCKCLWGWLDRCLVVAADGSLFSTTSPEIVPISVCTRAHSLSDSLVKTKKEPVW